MKYLLVNKKSGAIHSWHNSKDEAQKQLSSMLNKKEWVIK